MTFERGADKKTTDLPSKRHYFLRRIRAFIDHPVKQEVFTNSLNMPLPLDHN
jgi:hypothetical protein